MSGAASVNLKEVDLSTRVASFEGVYAGIVIPALKGKSSEPTLVTSDTQFLNRYTPDGKVEVGYDLSYFSSLAYLERANKLWVKRVINGAHYAGAVIKSSVSSYSNYQFPGTANLADPSAFTFDSAPDVAAIAEVTQFTFSQVGSFYDVVGAAKAIQLYNSPAVGHYFWFNVVGGSNTQTDPVLVGTGHQVDVLPGDTLAQVATKFHNAVALVVAAFTSANPSSGVVNVTNVTAGTATDATATGSAAAVSVTTQGAAAISTVDDALLIYASSEGVWGNSIGFKILKAADDTADNELAADSEIFKLQVFKSSNTATPVETFYCSRVLGKKDGRGRNIFVEDVLEASEYVRAKSNSAIDDNVLVKSQTSILYLADGNDGSAITSSNMIASAEAAFENVLDRNVTLLLDGGYSTPSYQVALDTIAQNRQDCVAILTTPYSDEASSNYMTDLIDYRKTDLNLNSSYSALYTPHLQIQDKFNDRKIWIAPDGHVAGSISFSASRFEIWYPPAGYNRGVLNVLDTRRHFSEGELDELANAGINPIKFSPGKGIVVWGQKTLLSRASALDRLNVRLLLIVIEPAIKDFLENYLFELNDAATRSVIETKLESYLETIKARRGITDYDVVSDDSNNTPEDIDANRLNVDIFIKPSRSIEEIPVRVVITPSNISFSEAAGAI
jgi:phage tail sheath protein FI